MNVNRYMPVTGIIQKVSNIPNNCCNLQVSVLTENGIVNLIVTPDTYVVNNLSLRRGMSIVGYFDADAPAILIFPPQYQALIITHKSPRENVELSYFDENLVNTDNSLKLNIDTETIIKMKNGQSYNCSVGENWLLVYYESTTRSIPAQTTPRKIIVLCQN